ncbi:DUF366 family protein [Peptococcaceae bacterium]|nr:DUF366 family protein [Peptococcaceae bacterium]
MIGKYIDKRINYDGTQLRSLWAFRQFGIQGDSIISFRGKCDVPLSNMADEAKTYSQIAEAKEAGIKAFNDIPIDPEREVLKVGLTGEIYVLLEPASNLEIEETLGHMGVEVERSMFLTGWTRDKLGSGTQDHASAIEAAKPYLPYKIGGHGRETIGHVVNYAKRKFDGVIQIAPFTCTPEIVARTILNKVSKEHDIPVLTFFFDEQTAKAGITTRLEAFIDLLKRKRLEKNQVAAAI